MQSHFKDNTLPLPTMGLSDRKEEELKNMPKIEFSARRSKDGRFIIHKTTFTDIKPVKYYEKVLEGNETDQVVVDEEQTPIST